MMTSSRYCCDLSLSFFCLSLCVAGSTIPLLFWKLQGLSPSKMPRTSYAQTTPTTSPLKQGRIEDRQAINFCDHLLDLDLKLTPSVSSLNHVGCLFQPSARCVQEQDKHWGLKCPPRRRAGEDLPRKGRSLFEGPRGHCPLPRVRG